MTNPHVASPYGDAARFILHPTDFSHGSEAAFAHALRLALSNQATLTILHVGSDSEAEWDRFPAVRQTLERWGYLEPHSQRADLAKLGITVKKKIVRHGTVANAIADHAESRQTDMVVLATEQRHDLARVFRPSVAEQTARKLSIPTLFVPSTGRGGVDFETGAVSLNQVLIPVDHDPPVSEAIERGLRAIATFGHDKSQLVLLHVGAESRFPDVRVPDGPWQVTRMTRNGDPVSAILSAEEETGTDLVIMVTKGADGFFDSWRGTTTEQVLRGSHCPILSIPAES